MSILTNNNMLDSKACPLLKLPRELRRMILKQAGLVRGEMDGPSPGLDLTHVFKRSCTTPSIDDCLAMQEPDNRAHMHRRVLHCCKIRPGETPNIFLASKQLFMEALEIVYSENSFFLEGSPQGILRQIMRTPNSHFSMIRLLHIAPGQMMLNRHSGACPERWVELFRYLSKFGHPNLRVVVHLSHLGILPMQDRDDSGTISEDKPCDQNNITTVLRHLLNVEQLEIMSQVSVLVSAAGKERFKTIFGQPTKVSSAEYVMIWLMHKLGPYEFQGPFVPYIGSILPWEPHRPARYALQLHRRLRRRIDSKRRFLRPMARTRPMRKGEQDLAEWEDWERVKDED